MDKKGKAGRGGRPASGASEHFKVNNALSDYNSLFQIREIKQGKVADVIFNLDSFLDHPIADHEYDLLYKAIEPYINKRLLGYQAGWGETTVVRAVARQDLYPLAVRLGQAAIEILRLRSWAGVL